jgi:hypothetical protein
MKLVFHICAGEEKKVTWNTKKRREGERREGTGYGVRSEIWLHYFVISLHAIALLSLSLFQTHHFYKNIRSMEYTTQVYARKVLVIKTTRGTLRKYDAIRQT